MGAPSWALLGWILSRFLTSGPLLSHRTPNEIKCTNPLTNRRTLADFPVLIVLTPRSRDLLDPLASPTQITQSRDWLRKRARIR